MSKVGIEVETAGLPGWTLTAGGEWVKTVSPRLARAWVAHHDGSVEGPELVLRRPLTHNGRALRFALEALGTELTHAQFSPNCSTHIHVDCGGDFPLLLRTMVVCALIEAAMFDYIGCPRANTNFATPLWSDPNLTRMLKHHELYDYGNRYLWVNPLSFFKHGSVEFRIFEGTKDPVQIAEWVRLCTDIVAFARGAAGVDPMSLARPTLVREVSPVLSRGVIVDEMNLKTSFRRNLPLIHALATRLEAGPAEREPGPEVEVDEPPMPGPTQRAWDAHLQDFGRRQE